MAGPGAVTGVGSTALTKSGEKENEKVNCPVLSGTPTGSAPGPPTVATRSPPPNFTPRTTGVIEITPFHVCDHVTTTPTVVLSTRMLHAIGLSPCVEGRVIHLTSAGAVGGSTNTVSDLSPTPIPKSGAKGVVTVIVPS